MNDTAVETTVIARHTVIKGELHLSGPTIIAGRVEGSIFAHEMLEIAAEGMVEGDIQGILIDIQGSVKGNVFATQACRLGATAHVAGELRAANLAIAEGACFVGQVLVGGGREEADAVEEAPIDAAEEISAAHAVAGAINRIESLRAEAESVAAAHAEPPAAPTVRIHSQVAQAQLQRTSRIIKAR